MVIFTSYLSHYQRVNPINFHEITIFLWFYLGTGAQALLSLQGFRKAELLAAFHRFDVRREGASSVGTVDTPGRNGARNGEFIYTVLDFHDFQ